MVLKGQTASPLATIYEESSSFLAPFDSDQTNGKEETINGLISARAIPSVDIQRQRANEQEKKLPIEVRFRDGSKRYIHPSTTATMIINRRNLLDSSDKNRSLTRIFNSNYRQIFSPYVNRRTLPAKPPLVLTIITADDLRQAGLTPTRSSSASGSDVSTLTPSHPSPSHTYTSPENPYEVSLKQLSMNGSTSSLHSSAQLNSTASQPFSAPSSRSVTLFTQLPSAPSLKTSASSLQITLTNDENDRSLSVDSNLCRQSIQGANPSAFRPFLKSVRSNQQSAMIQPRGPSMINRKPLNPTPQQQQIVPCSQVSQESNVPMSISNITGVSYQSSLTQKNAIVSRQIQSGVTPNPSANLNSLLQMNSSNYPKSVNHSLNLPTNSGQTLLYSTNPTTKWLNIVSNSINDIPHLSSKYSRIPLRINLPVVAPRHNQKLVNQRNITVEKRLLDAGLSPETIALYERILDVAENRQMNIFSSAQFIDQYSYQSFF